jgi:acyl-CoA thioester hydrolase
MTIEIMPQHIDINGHVNNVQYVQWMQDVAIAHSQSVGGREAVHAMNATWFAREHHIKYLPPMIEGDVLRIRTWADTFHLASSVRRYEFFNERDGRLVAEASTNWVFIDLESGRPRPIPDDLKVLYQNA